MMKHLGQLLVEKGLCAPQDIQKALEKQKNNHKMLGINLMELGIIDEFNLYEALAEQFGIPFIPSNLTENADIELIKKLPRSFMKEHNIVPLRYNNGEIIVAFSNPLDCEILDTISIYLQAPIRPVLATIAQISQAISLSYLSGDGSPIQIIEDISGEGMDGSKIKADEPKDLMDVDDEAPVVRLINTMLSQAVHSRASDIHIEPFERELKIRYRIDGMLNDIFHPPKTLQSAIVSRIKVMSNLDIAERRRPQDGRIRVRVADKNIDIRVSIIPTSFGERVVLRLLDKAESILSLDELGMDRKILETFQELIKKPNGIILVTGPTGSGKTTTLYAALQAINTSDKNILTVEDPIEYQIKGVGQMQVNPKAGVTFSTGLRSILRQDPDVVMIGEIRDSETAEMAIQASLTGHLVLSTLHTNDAAGAITRLIEMGIEPFLVSSSLLAVIAQRLVRVLCRNCARKAELSPLKLEKFGLSVSSENLEKVKEPVGCEVCGNTGYFGRTGIFEFMLINHSIRDLIIARADSETIKNKAIQMGMEPLFQNGIRKVLDGITSFSEILRVSRE